jgi:hypothetical protein
MNEPRDIVTLRGRKPVSKGVFDFRGNKLKVGIFRLNKTFLAAINTKSWETIDVRYQVVASLGFYNWLEENGYRVKQKQKQRDLTDTNPPYYWLEID